MEKKRRRDGKEKKEGEKKKKGEWTRILKFQYEILLSFI